ncbi:MAG: hypothetical protein QW273_02450 [Candidatus Pacearchaeota archaeon]
MESCHYTKCYDKCSNTYSNTCNRYKQREVIDQVLVCLYRVILTKNNLKVAVDCIGKYRGRVAFEIAYRLGWISLKRKILS